MALKDFKDKFSQFKPIASKKKADTLSNGAFLIALGILFATDTWWPGILLAIWITLAIRQYLGGRIYDLCITTAVLIGLFAITILHLNWTVLMPVLFVVGGIYIIFREYFFGDDTNDIDQS